MGDSDHPKVAANGTLRNHTPIGRLAFPGRSTQANETRNAQARSALRNHPRRKRIYDQPPARRPDETNNDFRLQTRRRGTLRRTRLSAASDRPAPLSLEEREMGARPRINRPG